jgi:hypothetical protein
MKLVILIVAGLLALLGLIFFLQGIGILLGSSMTGQAQWALIGLVLMVIGGGVIYRNWRGRA